MATLEKGIDAFRKSVSAFTGQPFRHSYQEVIIEPPSGTIDRIYDVAIGRPSKHYTRDGKEVISQLMEVQLQLDFITVYDKLKGNLYESREILNELQVGWYSLEFKDLMNLNKGDVELSLMDLKDLRGPRLADGGKTVYSSSITATLNIVDCYEKDDIPCMSKEASFPLDIRLNLAGKTKTNNRGQQVSDDRSLFYRVCGEGEVKSKIDAGGANFDDLSCNPQQNA